MTSREDTDRARFYVVFTSSALPRGMVLLPSPRPAFSRSEVSEFAKNMVGPGSNLTALILSEDGVVQWEVFRADTSVVWTKVVQERKIDL